VWVWVWVWVWMWVWVWVWVWVGGWVHVLSRLIVHAHVWHVFQGCVHVCCERPSIHLSYTSFAPMPVTWY